MKAALEVALPVVERISGFHTPPGGYLPHRLQMLAGTYENEETRLMRSFLKRGQVILDVGANIGYLTKIFGQATGPSGRVLAFEPNPLIFPLLAQNVARLRQVDVYNRALSSKSGSSPLFLAGRNHSVASFARDYPAKHLAFHGGTEVGSVEVKVTTGDEFLQREEIAAVDLIKIDVEGWEIDVLNGLENTIAAAKNIRIFAEFNPEAQECAGHRPYELLEWFFDREFDLAYPEQGRLRTLSRASLGELSQNLRGRGYATILATRS